MRRSKYEIIASGIISSLSFLCYILPSPALFFTAQQMNEFLLALFGAGISVFFVSVCDYRHECRRLEDALLGSAERALTGLSELKECVIESIGDGSISSTELLIDYFEEEGTRALESLSLRDSNAVRDTLVEIVERCDASQIEVFISDPLSSFNRFVERSKRSIDSAIDSYLYLCGNDFDSLNNLSEIIGEIDYLPISVRACQKKRLLKQINDLIVSYIKQLTPVIQQCRLIKCNESCYGEVLRVISKAQEEWLSQRFSEDAIEQKKNVYARDLYQIVQEYASLTSSALKKSYPPSS